MVDNFLTFLFVQLGFLRIVSIHARLDIFADVLVLDLVKFLPVVVEIFQALQFVEKVTLVDNDDLVGRSSHHGTVHGHRFARLLGACVYLVPTFHYQFYKRAYNSKN